MITIEFCKDGDPISDFEVASWVEEVVATKGVDALFRVSTALPIHAIRVEIKNGNLSPNEVVFLFGGAKLNPDKNGRLADWPVGFCDQFELYLGKLL